MRLLGWSAGGTCDVVLMVVPARGGFLGEHFWEMVGMIGCLWQVVLHLWNEPVGDVLLYSFHWVFP